MTDRGGTQGYPGAPPGWYPDPAGGPGQRWWDGYAWNDAVVHPTPPPPPYSASPVPGAPVPGAAVPADAPWVGASARLASSVTVTQVSQELSMTAVARLAVATPAVSSLVALAIVLGNAARFPVLGHQMRVVWDDQMHHITAPPITETISFGWLGSILALASLGAVIVGCLWQHRSAVAARALDLHATHAAAWGVGSWFVPVVNLWMPYQAIRDCLPPHDHQRRYVLRWWLLLQIWWLTALGTGIAVFFSKPAAVGLAVPAAVSALAILATAPRMVLAIANAHRALLPSA